jgi:hypothetical protein
LSLQEQTYIKAEAYSTGAPDVTDLDDVDDFSHWIRLMNKNSGYGGGFNYDTPDQKRIIELSTAMQRRKAVAAEFDLKVGVPQHNPNDPPDCFVEFEGKRLGLELVQLVAQDHRERAATGETPYQGQLFLDMQWTKERLVSKLNQVLHLKGSKYEEKQIDILVIFTAEPWLTSDQARLWLVDTEVNRQTSISNACLLFDYEPGHHDPAGTSRHWPIIWLYGNMIHGRPCL